MAKSIRQVEREDSEADKFKEKWLDAFVGRFIEVFGKKRRIVARFDWEPPDWSVGIWWGGLTVAVMVDGKEMIVDCVTDGSVEDENGKKVGTHKLFVGKEI